MAGTQVMLYRSTDTGAPTLSGTTGALLSVLDGCLVDGYNSKTVQSITRVGTTATVTFATAHGYAADTLTTVRISGANETAYNGDWKISNVTTTTFDFTVAGSPATPATGTITAKVAPLGWGRAFTTAGNIAVYRSSEVTGTRLYCRVDDSGTGLTNGTRDARFRGYETMTDLNTGTGPFPTDAQISGGLWIGKSNTLDSTARNWMLAGDGFEFLLFIDNGYNATQGHTGFHFGDFASEMSSDPYGCLIIGSTASSFNAYGSAVSNYQNVSSSSLSGHYIARGYAQIGTSIVSGKVGNTTLAGNTFGASGYAYPAAQNNGLYLSPIMVLEVTTALIRGVLKCLYQPMHNVPLGHGVSYTNPAGLSGRTIYSVKTISSSSVPGETHIDITGPWR